MPNLREKTGNTVDLTKGPDKAIQDLKSWVPKGTYEFDSRPRHHEYAIHQTNFIKFRYSAPLNFPFKTKNLTANGLPQNKANRVSLPTFRPKLFNSRERKKSPFNNTGGTMTLILIAVILGLQTIITAAGWVIMVRYHKRQDGYASLHAEIARTRFARETEDRKQYLSANDAYEKGFKDGQEARAS